MLTETLPGCADLLEPALRVICLPLEYDQRASQFISHFRATVLQFVLAATEFLQFAFLFFDLLLLAFELQQLLLRLLNLRIQMLGRIGFVLAQFEHLFNRSNFLCHDNQDSPSGPLSAILNASLENSRYFR